MEKQHNRAQIGVLVICIGLTTLTLMSGWMALVSQRNMANLEENVSDAEDERARFVNMNIKWDAIFWKVVGADLAANLSVQGGIESEASANITIQALMPELKQIWTEYAGLILNIQYLVEFVWCTNTLPAQYQDLNGTLRVMRYDHSVAIINASLVQQGMPPYIGASFDIEGYDAYIKAQYHDTMERNRAVILANELMLNILTLAFILVGFFVKIEGVGKGIKVFYFILLLVLAGYLIYASIPTYFFTGF